MKAAYQSNLYSLAEARRQRETERAADRHQDTQRQATPAPAILPPLPLRDLCALEDAGPEANWLWDGYLAPSVFTVLSGKPKCGKSTLAFNLLRALQRGDKFLGQPVKPAKVVYLSEEPARSLRQKIARFGLQPGHGLILTRREAFTLRRHSFAAVIAAVVKQAIDFKAQLLMIDTIAFWAHLPPDAEKDSGAMQQVADVLLRVATEGLAVLAFHHDKKGDLIGPEAMRGSNALIGNADIALQLRAPRQDSTDRELRGVGRYDETPTGVRLAYAGGAYQLGGPLAGKGPEARRQRVLAQLPTNEPGLTVKEAAERLGMDRRQVAETLAAAHKDQLVRWSGAGTKRDPHRYRLSPDAGAFTSGG